MALGLWLSHHRGDLDSRTGELEDSVISNGGVLHIGLYLIY